MITRPPTGCRKLLPNEQADKAALTCRHDLPLYADGSNCSCTIFCTICCTTPHY